MTGNGDAVFGRALADKTELDLAMLPAADTRGAEKDDQGAAPPQRGLQLWLPGLAGGKRVAVEEGLQAGVLVEVGAQAVGGRSVGAAVAQEDVVARHRIWLPCACGVRLRLSGE